MNKIQGTKLLATFSILFVILISGCTFPPATPTGSGVVIVDFYSDFYDIYVGETVVFNLKVQNRGSVDATDVFAELLGLDEDFYEGNEQFPNEQECRWDGEFFTLSPPRPEYNVDGETHACTWDYKSPTDIPKGTSVSYEATARVFYTYKTDVIKTVTLVSYDRMKELQQQGKTFAADTTSQTTSPVSITATTRSPIRVFENNEAIFPLEITIENVGGGVACRTGQCKKQQGGKWNEILLKIEFLSSGMSIVSGSGCEDFAGGNGEYISVWLGKPNKITCDIRIDDTSSITGPVQKPIRISADYSYFVEKVIPLRVSSLY